MRFWGLGIWVTPCHARVGLTPGNAPRVRAILELGGVPDSYGPLGAPDEGPEARGPRTSDGETVPSSCLVTSLIKRINEAIITP